MSIEDTWKHDKPKSVLRWRARVRGVPNLAFRTRAEAEDYERRMRYAPPKLEVDITVDELADRFLKTKAHLAAKTQEMYGNGRRHVLAEFSGWQASTVKASDVKIWVANISGSGSLRQQAMLTLSGMFDLIVKDGDLDSNPCDGVSVARDESRDPRFLTPAELVRLAAASVHGESHDDEFMMLLMGTTALRVSEASGLNVNSINFDRGRGRVTKTKGRRARDIPIPADVSALLAEHVEGRAADEPLFRSPTGGRINTRNWRERVFYPAAMAAGLTKPDPGEPRGLRPGVRPHDLRHTAASLAIAAGADVKAVQAMMGHTKSQMTLDLYSHLWPGTLDDVAVRMNGLLKVPMEARRQYTSSTHGPDGDA